MKTALLTLFFLLFAFTTKLSLATNEPVLDIDGEPLVPGSKYYVLPHIWPGGGGLGLAKTGNETRAVSVIQEPSYSNNGEPILLTPQLEKDFVPVNRALEIKFPQRSLHSKWLIVNDLKETWSVGTGSAKDHQGFDTLTGYFKVHRYAAYAYSFTFQPLVNFASSGDIGRIRDDDGNVRLAVVPGEPYPVIFRKASSEIAKM